MNQTKEEKSVAASTIRLGDAKALLPRAEPVLTFFGDYTVLGEIAAGGMGVVYHARQRKLNRTVALKMIRTGSLATEEVVRRFRIEAEAAANLDHPNIVPIYELGEHEGRHYFSMKLVGGESLHDLNARCAVRDVKWLRHAAQLTAKIARAVQHAHERGILHRDLKPRNILVDENGEPHVTDFGLAKVLGQTTHETMADAVMGTPHYMSPEQGAGNTRDVTTAADVYSLGAMLFELLTGRPPFVGETMMQVIQQVCEALPPNPSELNRAVPGDLATICLKCLEKEPHHRYPSAAALADELERWLAGEPILARPSTPGERLVKWVRRNPNLAAALGVAITCGLIAVIGITWQWLRAEENFSNSQQLRARLEIQRAEDFFAGDNSSAALAVLARVLRDDPANHTAASRLINALSYRRFLVPIEEPIGQGAKLASFTPEGHLLFAGTNQHGNIALLRRAGGKSAVEIELGEDRPLSIATSGQANLLAAGSERGARVWNTATGKLLSEPVTNEPVQQVAFVTPKDAGAEVFVTITTNSVRLWSTDSWTLTREFPPAGDSILLARLAADRQHVALAGESGAIFIGGFETALRWVAIPNAHSNVIRSLQFSSDQKRLVSAGADGAARVWDVSSGALLATLPAGQTIYHAEFDAKNARVVTAGRDGTARLWDANLGQVIGQPMRHKDVVNTARFSPDQKFVVTASDDGTTRLWSGTDGQRIAGTIAISRPMTDASFSGDGQTILSVADEGAARLFAIVGGKNLQPSYLELSATQRNLMVPPADLLRPERARFAAGHGDELTFVDVSADGKFVATASADRTVRLWDRASRRSLCDPLLHEASVNCVRFSADGALVVSSTVERKIRVWDTKTGQAITDWIVSSESVAQVWLSTDGAHVVAAPEGEVWSIYTGHGRVPDWLPVLAEAVAGVRHTANRMSEPVSSSVLKDVGRQLSADNATNWISIWAKGFVHELPMRVSK